MNIKNQYIVLYAQDRKTTKGFVKLAFRNGETKVSARADVNANTEVRLLLDCAAGETALPMQARGRSYTANATIPVDDARIVAAVADAKGLLALGQSQNPKADWRAYDMKAKVVQQEDGRASRAGQTEPMAMDRGGMEARGERAQDAHMQKEYEGRESPLPDDRIHEQIIQPDQQPNIIEPSFDEQGCSIDEPTPMAEEERYPEDESTPMEEEPCPEDERVPMEEELCPQDERSPVLDEVQVGIIEDRPQTGDKAGGAVSGTDTVQQSDVWQEPQEQRPVDGMKRPARSSVPDGDQQHTAQDGFAPKGRPYVMPPPIHPVEQKPVHFQTGEAPGHVPISVEGPYAQLWKWRRIASREKGYSYLMGQAEQNGKVVAVAVAVPGEYAPVPPANLQGFSVYRNGYWLLAQDAVTGERIPI